MYIYIYSKYIYKVYAIIRTQSVGFICCLKLLAVFIFRGVKNERLVAIRACCYNNNNNVRKNRCGVRRAVAIVL